MRLLFAFFAASVLLLGSEIAWQKDYASALSHAKNEGKLLFVFMSGEDCKFCKKYEATTFKDPKIIERINKEYVSVHLDKVKDSYPKALETNAVPKLYFLDANGEIIDYSLGYWDADDFGFILKDVQKRLEKRGAK
ncbi:MAG: thioredoxin family protein [Epsilonproteobacteria bacterium]|nr:thioredoxin family protein [Campylobacterota bacterium]